MDAQTFEALQSIQKDIGKVLEGQANGFKYMDNISNRLRTLDEKQQKHELDGGAHNINEKLQAKGLEEPGKIKDRHIAIIALFASLVVGLGTIYVMAKQGR